MSPIELAPGIPRTWTANGFTGELAGIACYGLEVGYTARYQSADGKQVVPFFRCENGVWRPGAAPTPRPLFGLESIFSGCTLFITEGEGCAALLHQLGMAAVTWPGGSRAVHLANWACLKGRGIREIVLWPDADECGQAAMQTIAELLP